MSKNNVVRLSKSTFCSAKQCNKILWLNKYKPNEATLVDESVFEIGKEVGECAKKLFGDYQNVTFENNLSEMINKTEEYIKDGIKVITEASFAFNNNFCSVDILKNNNGILSIYEVKSSTEIKDIYYDDLAYQYYVLSKLGYKIKSANIVYLNNQYYRHGDLELDKLFIIQDLTGVVHNMQSGVETKIHEIYEYMKQEDEPVKDISPACSDPYECKYWSYCTKHLPINNVFNIAGLTKKEKFKHYYSGAVTFEDLRFSNLKPKFLEQVLFELDNKPPYINQEEISNFLAGLYYPIYFLDFETYQQAIPLYDGINPYMQIPFQYSLHYIEEKGGELKHYEFLAEAGVDQRELLAKQLVANIPSNACVLAYNMGFEKGVIRNLAKNYPSLEMSLMNIHDHIQDLMLPFQKRDYYAKEMMGSYSIKKVLPTLFPHDPELNYHSLAFIHNGSEAMTAFADLNKMSKEMQTSIREALLKYCELDTLAMVKIWQKLIELSLK